MNAMDLHGLERMNALAKELLEDESYFKLPNLRPKDAATLILIDNGGPIAKVLLGKRHHGHKFMPGKYVFPGGGVEPADQRMPTARPLDRHVQQRLMRAVKRPSPEQARALALAAIRETYEETGLLLGAPANDPAGAPPGPGRPSRRRKSFRIWRPSISSRGRLRRRAGRSASTPASSPPMRARSRIVRRDDRARRRAGRAGLDADREARRHDMPAITAVVLEELEARIAAGLATICRFRSTRCSIVASSGALVNRVS